MPDTCFCDRCLLRFQKDTAITLPQAPTPERAALLLSTHRSAWVRWRLGVFTDWVREFRDIRDAARLAHCSAPFTIRGATRILAAPDLGSSASI